MEEEAGIFGCLPLFLRRTDELASSRTRVLRRYIAIRAIVTHEIPLRAPAKRSRMPCNALHTSEMTEMPQEYHNWLSYGPSYATDIDVCATMVCIS